jgi:hypothetical protein
LKPNGTKQPHVLLVALKVATLGAVQVTFGVFAAGSPKEATGTILYGGFPSPHRPVNLSKEFPELQNAIVSDEGTFTTVEVWLVLTGGASEDIATFSGTYVIGFSVIEAT